MEILFGFFEGVDERYNSCNGRNGRNRHNGEGGEGGLGGLEEGGVTLKTLNWG